MNAAVPGLLPSYGFREEGSQDVPMLFSIPASARMAGIRRRMDDAADYGNASPPGWNQAEAALQHGQQPYPATSLYGSSSNPRPMEYLAAPIAGGDIAAASTLNEPSDPSGQRRAAGVSPYPDVSSYSQQPYFFQQTHPSTYNSPWPPAEAAHYGAPAHSYSNPAPTHPPDMPYFPSQPPAESGESGFDGLNVQQQRIVPAFAQDGVTQAQFAYASRNENGVPRSDIPPEESAFLYEDASMHVKVQSLPILENLATQLIHTIAKASFPQIQEIMRSNDDEESQAYTTLKNLFDQTRKVYSHESPFIDAIAIQMFQPAQQETIRKANIATFLSNILGAHDVSFFHLNEFFMETFVPLGHRLLKWQGAVYLELKTQTYISALINSEGNPEPEAMLDELFPPDLDAQILTRHPDAPALSPSEQDFIDRSRARKSYLLAEESTSEALKELPKKYQWQDFVREFASSINKNVDSIMNLPTRSQAALSGPAADRRGVNMHALSDTLAGGASLGGKGGAALVGVQSLSLNASAGLGGASSRDEGPKKPAPTASTIRQPWTKPEEDALLFGLEKVNGPHWSQILALYGRGGSVSEVLKDRNQVQLKDKARNLKLWYLKMGKEVPPALRGVTGELRKRGGARARAALGMAEEEDAGGEGESFDAGREGDAEGGDGGLERRQSAKAGQSAARRKSKKGS